MLTTGYPHAEDPVAGGFVRAMARALAARGHTVRVLFAALPGGHPLGDPGVTVTPVRYHPARTFYGAGAPHTLLHSPAAVLGGGVFTLSLARAAVGTLSRCDALVSHFALPCGLVGGWVRAGRAHLAVVHGTDGRWLARCPRALQRYVLGGATSVQFTHEALRRALPAVSVPVVVRPMGFDPIAETAPRAVRETVTVLAVGRLVAVKRMDRVIEAVAMVHARGARVRLVIVGDGPERAGLQALADARGLRTEFTGAVDASVRDGWLAEADVFVHGAGEGEGAPVAVLEAMGAGLAVIAHAGGGVGELVGDAGIMVESTRAMADALEAVVGNAELRQRMGAEARARAWPLRWEAEAQRVETVLGG